MEKYLVLVQLKHPLVWILNGLFFLITFFCFEKSIIMQLPAVETIGARSLCFGCEKKNIRMELFCPESLQKTTAEVCFQELSNRTH